MLEVLYSFFYGIVEGITEWLPISSTGHLILFEQAFPVGDDAFTEMFRVVIQLGAILAVVMLYWNKLWPFSKSKTPQQKQSVFRLWVLVLIGCVPAGIIGVLFDDKLDAIFYNMPTVAITLIVYGVLFIVVENAAKKGRIETKINSFAKVDYKLALFIGLFQLLALIPGTSRSGVTILGAMILGCSRGISAEYSFFMSIPVMFGASLIKCMKYGVDMVKTGDVFTGGEIASLIIGVVTAFVVSVFAIKFLMNFIKKHDFKAFGYYRIVLGAIVMLIYIVKPLPEYALAAAALCM